MTSGIEGAQGAELEEDLGGVAVWDVSHLLPIAGGGYPLRELRGVTHEFVHHSGRLGRPGFDGLYNSTRYVVNQKQRSRGKVGFPGCAYHLWLPFEPCRDGDGRLVIFRANAPEVRCWHTGGELNGYGESIALQGNTTKHGLSEFQVELLEAVLPWRLNALSLLAIERAEATMAPTTQPTLSWHSEGNRWPDSTQRDGTGRSKAACPGAGAVRWLTKYRQTSDWAGHPQVDLVA